MLIVKQCFYLVSEVSFYISLVIMSQFDVTKFMLNPALEIETIYDARQIDFIEIAVRI